VRLVHFTPLALLSLIACSGGDDDDTTTPERDAGSSVRDAGDTPRDGGFADAGSAPDGGFRDGGVVRDGGTPDGGPNLDCDPLMPSVCSFPWPSNLYLEEDGDRVTGYTLAFGETSLAVNLVGQQIDPEPYRRLDGYGPGQPIMMHFADLDATNLPDENDIGASLDADAEILLFRAGGKGGLVRVPYWAELDGNEADAANRVLFVRPAVILREASRYVVAVRGLADTNGTVYPRSDAFARLAAQDTANDPQLAPRQAAFDTMWNELSRAGVDTDDVQLAWDFTTASSEAMHGPLLAMRDEALGIVGTDGPPLTVTTVEEFVPVADKSGLPVNEHTRLRIRGTLSVPNYLGPKSISGFTSTVLNRDGDGMPVRDGNHQIDWWMLVPHSATSTRTHGILQYGHGLLGSGSQTWAGHNAEVANTHGWIYFGTNWTGFDTDMQLAVGIAVRTLSGFEWIADTLHQGMIDALVLGRAMRGRITTLQPLIDVGVDIDTSDFHYEGISQGGIFGATYMALSTDVTRGHLGVPGANYSTLLHRSVDFTPFFTMIAEAYPDTKDQAVLLAAVQLLWDSTDSLSHYRHIKQSPFPNTPSHEVLLGPAKGDHQVAVVTNEIIARSDVGVRILEDYDDERTVWGVVPATYPHTGSGVVLWDFGNAWPEPGNLPPTDGDDPHGLPRRDAAHNVQMTTFLRTGEIIDVCGGDGCHPN
jgi:hypothetical protein